jgi:hypothetical protein
MRPSGAAVFSSLDAGFLRRVRKSSLVLGLLLAIPLAMSFGWQASLAWIAGSTWSLFNLMSIAAVVRRVVTLEPRDRAEIAKALAIKFPVLYVAGVGILVSGLPIAWVLAGFAWPFTVAVLKAAGRTYLRMDEIRP